VLLHFLKVEVLLLNSILSRVRNSGVLGLIAVEDKAPLTDAMDAMDTMDTMDHPMGLMAIVLLLPLHLRGTRELFPLRLMSMSLLARPAPTLLQKASRPIIHAPSPLSLTVIRDPEVTTEDADTVPVVDITTTITTAHLHSPSI
jgi:hypothetical protein